MLNYQQNIDHLENTYKNGIIWSTTSQMASKCPHICRQQPGTRVEKLKELGTSRTHSAVIRCLTICQHIPVVRKNHKNQLTQQFDIICCLARCLALCTESKQMMSLLSCESATLKRGLQLCGQRCGPYLRH